MNYQFLKEWKPFEQLNKKAQRAIVRHFINHPYTWQPTNEESSKRQFSPLTFSQINNVLGLAYTSSSDYAGLWCCNGGYLWADNTHYFIGFAINEGGEVVGIAQDKDENEIIIKL